MTASVDGHGAGVTGGAAGRSARSAGGPVLSPIEYHARPDAIREAMERRDVDVVLITEPSHLRWSCGFSGSTGHLVVTSDYICLIVDGRYGERAEAEVCAGGLDVETVVCSTGREIDAEVARRCVVGKRIALEGDRLAHDRFVALRSSFNEIDHDCEVTSAGTMFATLRRRKQPGEIERMANAAAIADEALVRVAPNMVGRSERDVQADIDYHMQMLGSEGVSFDTIVASGPEHGARPHHRTSQRVIATGDTVIVDLGAVVDGYHSDMTRSFVVGEPTPRQRDRYAVLAEAQQVGVAAAVVGASSAEVDAKIRDVLAAASLDELFVHGTGHGVGLEIHEQPFIGRNGTDVLIDGDVITIEPGVYEPGFGGFRIEDLVVVTTDGPRKLTGYSTQLVSL